MYQLVPPLTGAGIVLIDHVVPTSASDRPPPDVPGGTSDPTAMHDVPRRRTTPT